MSTGPAPMAGDEVFLFRLEGSQSLATAVRQIDEAIGHAREQGVRKLLLDVRELTGFAPPSLGARMEMVRQWAGTAQGRMKIAMLSRREINDPERFDVIFARSLGFDADVFEAEAAALEWLHEQPALWTGPPTSF